MEGCDTANMVKCYRLQTIEEMVDLLYVQKFLQFKKKMQSENNVRGPPRHQDVVNKAGGWGRYALPHHRKPRFLAPPSHPRSQARSRPARLPPEAAGLPPPAPPPPAARPQSEHSPSARLQDSDCAVSPHHRPGLTVTAEGPPAPPA